MGRVLLATIVGAIIVFAWGAVSWTVLDWHWNVIRTAPKGDQIAERLKEDLPRSGVYFLPMPPHDPANPGGKVSEADQEAWAARHRAGPVAMILIQRDGMEPMDPMVFARGLGIAAAGAFFMACIARICSSAKLGLLSRWAVTVFLPLFASAAVIATHWNYFYQPTDWAIHRAADVTVGWSLAGFAIAAITGPKKKP